ncbi:MAG: DUF1549 domain-containing protein [Bryobacteraceae bacterium]
MLLAVLSSVIVFGFQVWGQSAPRPIKHPPTPKGSIVAELDGLTTRVAAKVGTSKGPPPVIRENYVDEFIFGRMKQDGIPHAPLSGDEEFFRRVTLDLIGRIPEAERVRKFLADTDPAKRERLIDELTNAKVDPAAIEHPSHPFLDRWTYFFGDLFKNAAAEIGVGAAICSGTIFTLRCYWTFPTISS